MKTRNQQLKTHCLSFRDLSERLGKEVKRLNHELNMERARRQPTLRHTTSINNKNRHANTVTSHDKKKARRVKSEPYSNNNKAKTLMKVRKSKTINTLRVQDLKSSEDGNIGHDRTTKELANLNDANTDESNFF